MARERPAIRRVHCRSSRTIALDQERLQTVESLAYSSHFGGVFEQRSTTPPPKSWWKGVATRALCSLYALDVGGKPASIETCMHARLTHAPHARAGLMACTRRSGQDGKLLVNFIFWIGVQGGWLLALGRALMCYNLNCDAATFVSRERLGRLRPLQRAQFVRVREVGVSVSQEPHGLAVGGPCDNK